MSKENVGKEWLQLMDFEEGEEEGVEKIGNETGVEVY